MLLIASTEATTYGHLGAEVNLERGRRRQLKNRGDQRVNSVLVNAGVGSTSETPITSQEVQRNPTLPEQQQPRHRLIPTEPRGR